MAAGVSPGNGPGVSVAWFGAEGVAGRGRVQCARGESGAELAAVIGIDRVVVNFDRIRSCPNHRSPSQDNKFDERGQCRAVGGGEECAGGEGGSR